MGYSRAVVCSAHTVLLILWPMKSESSENKSFDHVRVGFITSVKLDMDATTRHMQRGVGLQSNEVYIPGI